MLISDMPSSDYAFTLLKLIFLGYLLAWHLVFTYDFLVAYFSPAKAVIIYIDRYQEANIELIILGSGWILGFYCFLNYYQKVLRKKF